MTGLYIMLGGMVLFATVVGVWDFLAERQARARSPHQARQRR
jgi:hypothetical protein